MDRHELLKAVYEAIQWDRLYDLVPETDRNEVDGLFRQIRQHLPPEPEEAPEKKIEGGAALLYSDGASRGNPGPAGIGMVIAMPDGREVMAWGEPIGKTTNNVAEYRAAIRVLQKARELGVREVSLRSDSQLMIRQIKGSYKVRNARLKPQHGEVMELLAQFDDWEAEYIPREKNHRADSCASKAARRN